MTEIETGNVTRYCKPSTLENGIPKSSAFQRRTERNEKYLSVYLLDFFEKETELANIREAKTYIEQNGFTCKPNGSFAVFNIQQSKEYIFAEIACEISCREKNLPHCGIFHEADDDLLIAKLLAQCVRENYLVKNLADSTALPPSPLEKSGDSPNSED